MPIRRIDPEPPAGFTRRQRRRWRDDWLTRRELETASVVAAATVLAGAAGPVDEKPARPPWWRRLLDVVMRRRSLLSALTLVLVIDVSIVLYQIGYYRALPGMAPQIAELTVRLYLVLPLIGEGVGLYFGMLAALTVQRDVGRFRTYLRLMWLFSAVNSVINASNALALDTADHELTAVYLGALSLISPLVWHSYVGITIADKTGLSIAELQRLARQCSRHPVLAWKTARARDAFPEMTRDQVWGMVVGRYRVKLEGRYTVNNDADVKQPEPVHDPGPDRPGGVPAAPAPEQPPAQRSWTTRLHLVGRERARTVKNEREPASTRAVNDPVELTAVNIIVNRPDGEQPGEQPSGEREPVEPNAQQRIVRAWFAVFGDHLATPGSTPRGWQARLARDIGCTPALVTKTITQCKTGKFTNPFTTVESATGKGAVND